MTNPKHTDTSRSGDLKPCPFCGGEAVDFYRANTGATADWCGPVDHWVCCTGECGASTCMHGTKDEAVAAWNTRTADRIEALEAENERLRGVLLRIADEMGEQFLAWVEGGCEGKDAIRLVLSVSQEARAALGEKQ